MIYNPLCDKCSTDDLIVLKIKNYEVIGLDSISEVVRWQRKRYRLAKDVRKSIRKYIPIYLQ